MMGVIRILPQETSRRIAAGEVIDRPASALRELLDNAIDADARDIAISIAQGGIEEITVTDNGFGMTKEDLELSVLEHATSKIYEPDDILKARTLGFRGEALASIAAVSRLEIASRPRGSNEGWLLRSVPLQPPAIDAFPCKEGTRVTVRGLFESYPARKQFLKRPQSEALLCRTTFIERALSHPHLTFRWQSANDAEVFLPGTHAERIARCYPDLAHAPLVDAVSEAQGLHIHIVYADISVYRRDRKYIQVFVNRRKVPEWGVLSLVEYEFAKYLPGGAHACAFLFLEIDPGLADFNIHPAKKEVRLKNAQEVHAAIHALLSSELKARYSGSTQDLSARFSDMQEPEFFAADRSQPQLNFAASAFAETRRQEWGARWPSFSEAQNQKRAASNSLPADFWQKIRASIENGPRYIGRGPGPFLLFELDGILFIMDQHAAHERILYDRLKAKEGTSQSLLVPYLIDPEDNEHFLEEAAQALEFIGYRISKEESAWSVEAVPAIAASQALEALVEWLHQPSVESTPLDSIAAALACKAAVKDGDILDQAAAERLIAEALALKEPRCPHGRPVLIAFPREKLDAMFGRTLA